MIQQIVKAYGPAAVGDPGSAVKVPGLQVFPFTGPNVACDPILLVLPSCIMRCLSDTSFLS
ncbi:MAG: hypothetical protein AAF243_09750, partial [Cyanobacteria bacterium P01_A01_bin.137]